MYLLVDIRSPAVPSAGAAAGGVIGAAAGGEAGGVIGAAEVCAQTGPALTRATKTATPVKRCFMPISSLTVWDLMKRLRVLLSRRSSHLCAKQPLRCFVPDE